MSDLQIFSARKFVDTAMLSQVWVGSFNNASLFPARAHSVQFNSYLYMVIRGGRMLRIEDGVENPARTATNFNSVRATPVVLQDRAAAPFSISDDPGPYDLDSASRESVLRCGLIAAHDSRLFVSGHPLFPRTVRYSNLGDGSGWPSNNVFVLDDAEGIVTAMASAGHFVYIFTRREIYMIANVGIPGQEQRVLLARGIGCIAPDSIQKVGSSLVFLGEGGHVYELRGSDLQDISDGRVANVIERDVAHPEWVGSWYNARHRRYVLCPKNILQNVKNSLVSPTPSFVRSRFYEYRLDQQAWFVWELTPANHQILDTKVVLDTDGKELIAGVRRDPSAGNDLFQRVWLEQGLRDEFNTFRCSWYSTPVNFFESRSVRNRRVFVYTKETSTKSMTFDTVSDDDLVGQNATAALLDRSARYGNFNWGDGTVYRGHKPMKVAVGMRDGTTIPATGKHIGFYLTVEVSDLSVDATAVGGAALYGVELTTLQKERRAT